jgi:hypothetical protein
MSNAATPPGQEPRAPAEERSGHGVRHRALAALREAATAFASRRAVRPSPSSVARGRDRPAPGGIYSRPADVNAMSA